MRLWRDRPVRSQRDPLGCLGPGEYLTADLEGMRTGGVGVGDLFRLFGKPRLSSEMVAVDSTCSAFGISLRTISLA